MKRREFLQTLAVLACSPEVTLGASTPFSFDTVIARARELAASDYQDQRRTIPDALTTLSYDDHRKINFRANHAVWNDQGLFQLQLFYPGYLFDRMVDLHVVENGNARPLLFDPQQFSYGDAPPPEIAPGDLGHAGFRVHYPLHRQDYFDEFLVFLGASYFRLLGRDQRYGLSNRGLAVDTALPGGEEFPAFEAFWLERPSGDSTTLTLYALLNSPSITGAYRFVVEPRTISAVTVHCVLFPRHRIEKLGIAPLTSMFQFAENGPHRFDDFRPEVHDSDGLLLHTGSGEWLWRPLINHPNLQVNSFFDHAPRGFGLVQRDREFAHYQDLGAHYDQRPSHWVEPLDDWGAGRVELVEIPTDTEIHDNIVAFWVPAEPVLAGQRLEYRYRINAYLDNPLWPPAGRTRATRVGSATRPGSNPAPAGSRLFVVDFHQGDLAFLDDGQPLEALVSSNVGRVSEAVVQKNPHTDGWRVFFDFFPQGAEMANLRCFLRLRGHVLTETWSYLWTL